MNPNPSALESLEFQFVIPNYPHLCCDSRGARKSSPAGSSLLERAGILGDTPPADLFFRSTAFKTAGSPPELVGTSEFWSDSSRQLTKFMRSLSRHTWGIRTYGPRSYGTSKPQSPAQKTERWKAAAVAWSNLTCIYNGQPTISNCGGDSPGSILDKRFFRSSEYLPRRPRAAWRIAHRPMAHPHQTPVSKRSRGYKRSS